MAHSRKDMNDTLTAVLMSACAPGAAMPGRLVMEHVLLLSVLHHTVGVEVGSLSLRDGRVRRRLRKAGAALSPLRRPNRVPKYLVSCQVRSDGPRHR